MSWIIKWLACLMFILAVIAPARAENEKATDDLTLSPYFFIEGGDPSVDRLPLKETSVVVNISGVVADVHITQKYYNDGTRPINARYIFPASTRAAVHGMTMTIGQQVITAKIQKRQKAQKKFDQAKKEGKSASLLKQQRPNVFSMNVANIMPGDTIDIQLHYIELLVPSDGTYEFIYPSVVGPRYSNQFESSASERDKWIKSPYLPAGRKPNTKFNIRTKISTGIALQEIACTSHETDIAWESDSVASVSLKDPETFGGDRDYILKFRLHGKDIQSGLLLYEGTDENFFLLMVQPPDRVKPEDIPPREYIFVVDVSGSMHGFPLNTTKQLLKDLIGNLRHTDTFNVILFAGSSQLMSSSSMPATKTNVQKAIRLIDQQRGGGGTELKAALQKGFSLPRNESFSRTIAVITDGYVGAERDVFKEIQKNLHRTNVFAFGIGSTVNRYLIEGMAKAGQGEPFVVTEPHEAPGAAQKFREYIQSPVLTNIAVSYNGFETYDVEPAGIPDLFANRPVVIFGKWRGAAEGTIKLSGLRGSREYERVFNVTETKAMETNRALSRLWARFRIARLSDFNFSRGNPEREAEITSLGLTYNLLTAYTSFVAISEVVRNTEGQGKNVDQPLPLPLRVSNLAVGGSVSSLPEPELYLLVLMVAFMLSIFMLLKKLKPELIVRGDDRK